MSRVSLLAFVLAAVLIAPIGVAGDGPAGSDELNCTAVFPGVSTRCCLSLSPGSIRVAPTTYRPLTRMAYASGTSLSYHPGHFQACAHTKDAAYFLLGWHLEDDGGLSNDEFPVAELGLSFPRRARRRTSRHRSASVSLASPRRPSPNARTRKRAPLKAPSRNSDVQPAHARSCGHSSAELCRAYELFAVATAAAAALAEDAGDGRTELSWRSYRKYHHRTSHGDLS